MSQKYWFKPKRYGWGFMPVSWEGWLMTVALLLLVFSSAHINQVLNGLSTRSDILRFLLDLFLLIGVFSYFSEKKCDGDLRWRWGDQTEN